MTIEEAIEHARKVAERCPAEDRTCAYQHDKLADWLEELKAYRETGLTPEEVVALRESNEALKKDALPLAYAKVEGRLVELPCKVGAKVWITSACLKQYSPPASGIVRKFVLQNDKLIYLESLIWVDLGEGKKEYGFSAKSFGKNVFLTREAAEAALKEQEG